MGAKVCSWEEDLETMCDRFIGTMSVEQKEAWNLRWGARPLTWWDVAKDKDPWKFLIGCFVQSVRW